MPVASCAPVGIMALLSLKCMDIHAPFLPEKASSNRSQNRSLHLQRHRKKGALFLEKGVPIFCNSCKGVSAIVLNAIVVLQPLQGVNPRGPDILQVESCCHHCISTSEVILGESCLSNAILTEGILLRAGKIGFTSYPTEGIPEFTTSP